MNRPGRRAERRLAVLTGVVLFFAGCGSSSSGTSSPRTSAPTTPTATTSTPPAAAAAHVLERALLAKKGSPHVKTASCRPATAAEIANGPFGRGSRLQFTCSLEVSGAAAAPYDVQVQGNGCYVAERHQPGQALYGCGARVRA